MLECSGLDFFYQTTQRLKNISFVIETGKLVSLFGHNGSGKSTLLKILGGSLPAANGVLTIFSKMALNKCGYLCTHLRREVGVLFQGNSSDEKLSSFDNLVFAAGLYGLRKVTAIERAHLALERAGLTAWAHERVKSLSGGMRRRLELYRAFMHQPRIVFLDEPTAGLDNKEIAKFFAFLETYRRETGAVIIMASHNADELVFADQVIMLKDGVILSNDKPQAMLDRVNYLRCSVLLNHHGIPLPTHLFEQAEQPDGTIRAKIATQDLSALLNSHMLRTNLTKSFLIERPSLADIYDDLCQTSSCV